jgi:hypothetical protein
VITWTATDECGNSSTATTSYYVSDTTAPVISGNLTDLYYECPTDIVPADVTVTDNCGTPTLDVDVLTLELDECGNGLWEVVYTAIDECGNASSAHYYVSIYDETAPVLSETPADLVLDCQDEVPAAPVVTANDNCNGILDVTYVETYLGEVPAPGEESQCDLITPPISDAGNCMAAYNGTSWAMWLGSMPTMYKYYQVVEGSFEEFDNGTAHLQATLVNANNANAGFTIDAWYSGGYSWSEWDALPFPTGFKADCGGVDANYQDWTYYIMDDGASLIGWGDYAGSVLNITHAPSNDYFGFQVGEGANNLTSGFGSGGWFEYSGSFLVNGQPIFSGATVGGAGDFAFEHDCCPDYTVVRTWCATDCTGNTTCWTQEISFADLDGNNGPGVAPGDDANMTEVEGDFDFVVVKPNPARDMTVVSFTSENNNTLTMEVYDMSGRRINQLFHGNVVAGQTVNVDVNVNKFEDGIYTIRLFSSSNAKVERLMVTK